MRRAVWAGNVAAWAVVCAYSAHASIPHNPIKLPGESVVDARAWAPQGWAFFTRDAHEDQLEIFVADGEGGWRPSEDGPNASAANLFGASRKNRARANEAGTLLESVARTAWSDCKSDVATCAAAAVPTRVVNPLPEPTLCGHVLFSTKKAVPWAWAHGPKEVQMPVRVARVEVKC